MRSDENQYVKKASNVLGCVDAAAHSSHMIACPFSTAAVAPYNYFVREPSNKASYAEAPGVSATEIEDQLNGLTPLGLRSRA